MTSPTPLSSPPPSIAALLDAQARGEVTAVALATEALARIDADAPLGAWLRLDRERALAKAADVDARRAAGDPLGPLAGVPIGVKDQIVTRGLETTAASRILAGWVPPYDATAVERLDAADAVLLGKLNQDELAMGSSSESSAYGPVKNPWARDRVPGGSSGGSAAAVAAGHCPVTLGTDTGGSVRQPASFCGVVGLKPTYGRVSRWGAIAFASSLDQIGPVGATVADVARTLGVIAGHDPRDGTSLPDPVPDYLAGLAAADVAGLKVGVPSEYFVDGMDAEVEAAVRDALAVYESLGAELVPVSLPHTRYAVATYYLLATAEASSNLARYDGVRFGHRTSAPVEDIAELYAKTRAEGFGDEVKRRIILGTYALSSGYYDAYYLKAQKVRTLLRRDFEATFARCDVLATPTSPVTAFRLGERVADPLTMYLMDIFTIPSSLAGNTSLSLPCGLSSEGLPIGLQLIAPPLAEPLLLRAGQAYERATDWHRRRPGSREVA